MKKIIILGVEGCPTCAKLDSHVQSALEAVGVPVDVEKITDPERIMEYNAGGLPAVIIGREVKALRRVPAVEELISWLK